MGRPFPHPSHGLRVGGPHHHPHPAPGTLPVPLPLPLKSLGQVKVKGLLLHKEVLEEAGAGVGGLRQDEDPAPCAGSGLEEGLEGV